MKMKKMTGIAVVILLLIAGFLALTNKESRKSADKEDEEVIEDKQALNDGDQDIMDEVEIPSQPSTDNSKPVDGSNPMKNEKKDLVTEQVGEKDRNKGTKQGIVLKSLPKGSFEVQDNTVVDSWGVAVHHNQLPAALKSAESYTLTIDDQVYELKLNKFDKSVFGGQVSSTEHTKEEVEAGVVTAN